MLALTMLALGILVLAILAPDNSIEAPAMRASSMLLVSFATQMFLLVVDGMRLRNHTNLFGWKVVKDGSNFISCAPKEQLSGKVGSKHINYPWSAPRNRMGACYELNKQSLILKYHAAMHSCSVVPYNEIIRSPLVPIYEFRLSRMLN